MTINTDPRFKCPDGHLETDQAGKLRGDLYEVEKWWCTLCKRFFYLHTMNGSRSFSNGVGDSDFDAELSPEDGYEQGEDKIIRKIDRNN